MRTNRKGRSNEADIGDCEDISHVLQLVVVQLVEVVCTLASIINIDC
jgi:hypothetical protein